jgi:dipeptidyl aminopeptidase/acylaminoacyl peptidase
MPQVRSKICLLVLVLSSLLAGCSREIPLPTQAPALPTAQIVRSTQPSDASSPTPSPGVDTPTPASAFTPGPYAGLTIQNLAQRSYGGGGLLVIDELNNYDLFARYQISYLSDGLAISGFANVPHGEGPFPVVLVLHGYVDPDEYQLLTYTTIYADYLAEAGFIAIHPNYRNYAASDSGPNLFRVGFAIDVLNLIAIVREHGGQSGILEKADPEAIGLWGHSMGGGIVLRALAAGAEVDAALIYGSMSGDERRNFEHIRDVLDEEGERNFGELAVPGEALAEISPFFYYDRIDAPLSVHHGQNDVVVPVSWSEELCELLADLGKPAECFFYPGEDHIFFGQSERVFIDRTIEFFERYLK